MNYHRILDAISNAIWLSMENVPIDLIRAVEAHSRNPIEVKKEPSFLAYGGQVITPVENSRGLELYSLAGKTAVIPVSGVIGKRLSTTQSMCGGYDVDTLHEALDAATSNSAVKAVLLDINSPGGVVTGVEEAAAHVAEVSLKLPVVAFTETLSASAAYWIASQAGVIAMTQSARIGSVGVYFVVTDSSKAAEGQGLKIEVIKDGTFKGDMTPGTPVSDQSKAMKQEEVNKIGASFRGRVLSMRPQIKTEDMQGQVFFGDEAISKGFADVLYKNRAQVLKELNDIAG